MFSIALHIVIQPRLRFVSVPSAPVDRLARALTAASAAYLVARIGSELLPI